MSLGHGAKIVTDGLLLCLDAGNLKSLSFRTNNTQIPSGTDFINVASNQSYYADIFTTTTGVFTEDFGGMVDLATDANTTNEIRFVSAFSSAINGLTAWTMEFWVIVDQLNSDIVTLYTGGGANQNLCVYRATNTSWEFYGGAGDTARYIFTNSSFASTGVSLGAPFQVVFRGNGASANISLFINGNFIQTVGSSCDLATAAGQHCIGQEYDGTAKDSNQKWDGKIGSYKFYNRSLDDNEIKQNFNALRGRFGL